VKSLARRVPLIHGWRDGDTYYLSPTALEVERVVVAYEKLHKGKSPSVAWLEAWFHANTDPLFKIDYSGIPDTP